MISKNRALLLVFIAVMMVVAVIFAVFFASDAKNDFSFTENIYSTSDSHDENIAGGFHYASHSNKEFYGGLESAVPQKTFDEKVFGGILSHHLLVSSEIANYLSGFEKQSFKTIVLIGPDHFSAGSGISISKYPYKTPWGVLELDDKNIQKLIDSGIADHNEKSFETEHSISALVSHIKYFFPDTRFIPIILKRNVSLEKLDDLAKTLDNILPEDSLVLASVDFSHHLSAVSADFHDKISISAITNFDYERIFKSEIDSPSSIYALLKYLGKRGAKKIQYKNINSARFSGNFESEDVTSYLFAYFTKGLPEYSDSISVLNFGDAMFDRLVKAKMKTGKDPFEYIKGVEGNFLKGVDFIAANLEGPITENSNCQKKSFSFRFDPAIVELLFQNNIELVNLANNHSLDCYDMGLDDTKKYLDERGIGYFGGGRSSENSFIIRSVGEKKIAFVGIDDTLGMIDVNNFYPLIEKLKKENDYVVINIHWGNEYNKLPSQAQKNTAHKLIDSGADVIFGHHPHVIEPVEIYKNKPIFYSLGNFIFDQQTKETNEGIGVGAVLGGEQQSYYIFPYKISDTQPKLLSGKDMLKFCGVFLKDISDKDGCVFTNH